MTAPRIGSLFSGYGGLEGGIREVYPDATVAWHAEYDRDPSRILAHHWPDVPNYGDVTAIDWHAVEPVDIICGGSPCQDLSHAGKRAGMRAGTRSGLWASMCDAIEIIRPALVVWENVRGALSAGADSAVEPCPFCVGDKPGTTLRALGRVLGDLAELGYDATWGVVRAADAGAPHGRARIFIVATPDPDGGGWEGRGQVGAGGSGRGSGRLGWVAGAGSDAAANADDTADDGQRSRAASRGRGSHATPDPDRGRRGQLDSGLRGVSVPHSDGGGAPSDARRERHGGRQDGGGVGRLDGPDAGASRERERSRGVAVDRGSAAAADADSGRRDGGEERDSEAPRRLAAPRGNDAAGRVLDSWGPYGPAVTRWEHVIGRPAPAPTEPGRNGPRLSPAFVEWMQGLPAGHVTDVPDLSRNAQLKALGNGVVPQQAALAIRTLLNVRSAAA